MINYDTNYRKVINNHNSSSYKFNNIKNSSQLSNSTRYINLLSSRFKKSTFFRNTGFRGKQELILIRKIYIFFVFY